MKIISSKGEIVGLEVHDVTSFVIDMIIRVLQDGKAVSAKLVNRLERHPENDRNYEEDSEIISNLFLDFSKNKFLKIKFFF